MNTAYQAKKRFGQNFLVDSMIIHRLLHAIHAAATDSLVEIGPGLGALTLPLLEIQPALTIIEIDNDLVKSWHSKKNQYPDLRICHQDVLTVDFAAVFEQKLRVIGNLPYNISTPLLFHLFQFDDRIIDMHFMLQKEVVDRLVATPNSKAYGRLTVMAQYYCTIEKLFEVPPTAFKPEPSVTSAICRLIPKKASERYPIDVKKLAELVRLAFTLRRKTLTNVFKGVISLEQIQSLDLDPQLRPENLSLIDFCRLAELT